MVRPVVTRLAISFGAGFASVITPCVLPLVPGYLSAVSSVEPGQLAQGRVARRVLTANGSSSLTLVGAGVAKLATPKRLPTFLAQYVRLPRWFAYAAGGCLVTVELATGAGLLIPRTQTLALGSAATLFLAFSAATGRALRHGSMLECNCMGVAFRMRHDAVAVALNASIAAVCTVDATRAGRLPLNADHAATGAVVTMLCAILLVVVYWTVLFARSVVVADSLRNSYLQA